MACFVINAQNECENFYEILVTICSWKIANLLELMVENWFSIRVPYHCFGNLSIYETDFVSLIENNYRPFICRPSLTVLINFVRNHDEEQSNIIYIQNIGDSLLLKRINSEQHCRYWILKFIRQLLGLDTLWYCPRFGGNSSHFDYHDAICRRALPPVRPTNSARVVEQIVMFLDIGGKAAFCDELWSFWIFLFWVCDYTFLLSRFSRQPSAWKN